MKTFVLDGYVASHFIATATDGHNNEITLFNGDAKTNIGGTLQLVTNEAIQLFGGIDLRL